MFRAYIIQDNSGHVVKAMLQKQTGFQVRKGVPTVLWEDVRELELDIRDDTIVVLDSLEETPREKCV